MLKTIVTTFQTVMGSTHSVSHQSAVDTITYWRTQPPHRLLFDSSRRDLSLYFAAVDRLRLHSPSTTFNSDLLSSATSRLTLEFSSVLRRHSDPHLTATTTTTSDSTFLTDSTAYLHRYEDYVLPYEPPNDDVIVYLKTVAQTLHANGKINQCIESYKTVRKPFLRAHLKRLRFDEVSLSLSTSTNKRYVWDEMRVKMELWIQVSKICVMILFDKEKQLIKRIFGDIDDHTKDECFVGTVQDFANGLFSFVDAVSSSSLPYERMENVLAVYDAFDWVRPNANELFSSEFGRGIRKKFGEISSMIENDVTRMLHGFENAVLNEISGFTDDRGGVHSSTVYVMDQIGIIVRNKDLLAKFVKSTPALTFGDVVIPREDLGDVTGRSFVELHLILIIVVLQMNLDSKCRSYQNASLGQVFMMNNIRYIVRKIDGEMIGQATELREMIGESYRRKLDENIRSALDNYQALTCSKFLVCFEDEGLYVTRFCFKSRPSKTAARRRLRNFNGVYEEFRDFHLLLTIPDLKLRDEVRVLMHDKLVPAYVDFLDKLRNSPETNLLLESNIKYSVQDFQALLENLFANAYVNA